MRIGTDRAFESQRLFVEAEGGSSAANTNDLSLGETGTLLNKLLTVS